MPSTSSLLALALTCLVATAAPATKNAEPTRYFVTFGDSYSQTGFNASLGLPNPSNVFGNPPYPGWTTSGAANWIGFLTTAYNRSLTYNYNFAYGGATTDAALVKPFAPTVLSLIDQIGLFNNSIASHPAAAPWTGANSLFGVWIGVNDVGNSWWLPDVTVLLNKIMDRYFEQVNALYAAGARNFVFLSVPPIQRTPTMLAQTPDAQNGEAAVIAQYNSIVANRTAAFLKTHAGSTAKVVDTQTPFNTVLNSPKAYGAPDASCYSSDGKSCLWFNDYHPGVAIHQLVAQAVSKAVPTFFKC